MNFPNNKARALSVSVMLLFILVSVAPGQQLSRQITAAVTTEFPDCKPKEPLILQNIALSGTPTIRGSFDCGKNREVKLNLLLVSDQDQKEYTLRFFFARSIMPPTRKVDGIGENPGMLSMNGRTELQFSKGNVVYRLEGNFPGDKSKSPYYYFRAPEAEELFLIGIGKTIDRAVPNRERMLNACTNDFAWPAVDYGVSGEERLFTSIVRGDSVSAGMLIGLGTNLEADFGNSLFQTTGDEKMKPLHIAIALGCGETVRALVQAGASVNSVTAQNETPLMFAVSAHDTEMVKLLLQKGAKTDTRTSYGLSAPFFLFQSYLNRRRGVNVEQKLAAANEILSVLKENESDIKEHEPRDGNTLFTLLAENCGGSDWCIEMSNILLKNGLDINAVDGEGRSVLFKAASKINPSQSAKIFEHLLANGADPNIKTKSGETVISYLNYHAEKNEYYGNYYRQLLVLIKLAEKKKSK